MSYTKTTYENRPEWLAARRKGIGASDTAGIFGVGYRDQSQVTVWESKTQPREDSEVSKRMLVGKAIEPGLRRIFEMETGLVCTDPGEFTIYTSVEYPFLTATLDGLAMVFNQSLALAGEQPVESPVELKNIGGHLSRDWEDEPPLKYQCQMQHQLAVTGAPVGYLFALIGGNEPIVIEVPRNEKFIAAMIDRLEEFWGYVTRNQMPQIDESEATTKALGRLYPDDNGLVTILPDEASDWAAELADAKAAMKAAEARENAAKNLIIGAIGESTFGELPDGSRMSWKSQTRSGVDMVKLRRLFPDAARECAKESKFRVLRTCK